MNDTMFSPDQYELLDFGEGRKLERFGKWLLDRPAPAADGKRKTLPADQWSQAHGQFQRKDESGHWHWRNPVPPSWAIRRDSLQFELKPTDFGHVGLFPDQADNWQWLQEKIRRAARPLKILNLFAHTGGATLAAAAAGAEVAHIDAAKNVVNWARKNAELSSLADAKIRWIAEDAPRFVARELRRENRYDGIILDPPSYGHGPKGEVWKLSHDLMPLLAACAKLIRGQKVFFLLTCHTPGFGPPELEAMLSEVLFGSCGQGIWSKQMYLATRDGRRLAAGTVARWPK